MENHSFLQPYSKFLTVYGSCHFLLCFWNSIENPAMVCVFVNLLQITRQQVNLFDSGKNIPKCELVLEWSQDTPPALLHHSIDLLGAGDHDYFLLHVNPGKCLPCFYPFCPVLVTCSIEVGDRKLLCKCDYFC